MNDTTEENGPENKEVDDDYNDRDKGNIANAGLRNTNDVNTKDNN